MAASLLAGSLTLTGGLAAAGALGGPADSLILKVAVDDPTLEAPPAAPADPCDTGDEGDAGDGGAVTPGGDGTADPAPAPDAPADP
ncbi:MAG: hypothetical protein ACRDZ3_10375, partial [Acidimicrobiia bacterium]